MDPFNIKASLRALAATKRQEPAPVPEESRDPIQKLGSKIQSDIVKEAPPGLLERAGGTALSGLAIVGNALDLPGSVVRDTLTWLPGGHKPANPIDQFASPFTHENRTTGRDLLRGYGLAGKEDTMANFTTGIGAEIALDPLTYLTFGGSALTKGGRAARALNLSKNAAEIATALRGRKVGAREARHIVTPRMLLENVNPRTKKLLEERMRTDFGLQDKDFDRQLGGLARISLPFTDKPFSWKGKPFTFWGLTDEDGIIGAGKIRGRGRDVVPPGTKINPDDLGPDIATQATPHPPDTGPSAPAPIKPGPEPTQPVAPAPVAPAVDNVVPQEPVVGKAVIRQSPDSPNDMIIDLPGDNSAQAIMRYASDADENPMIFLDQFVRQPKAVKGTGRKMLDEIIEVTKDRNPSSITGAFDDNTSLGAFASKFGKDNLVFRDRATSEIVDVDFKDVKANPSQYTVTHYFKPEFKPQTKPATEVTSVKHSPEEIEAGRQLGYEIDDIPRSYQDTAAQLGSTPVRLLAAESAANNLVDMVSKEGRPLLEAFDELDRAVEFRLGELGLPNPTAKEIEHAKQYLSVVDRPIAINDLIEYGKSRVAKAGKADAQAEAERIFKKFGRFDLDENLYYRAVLGEAPKPKQQKGLIDEGFGDVGLTFKTERGSEYKVLPDGTTQRNKAARAEHPGDSGIKEPSIRTIYLEDDGRGLSGAGIRGADDFRVVFEPDGTVSLVSFNRNTGEWGRSPSGTKIKYHNEPAVGRQPLELWKREDLNGLEAYQSQHIGNKITEISGSKPVAEVPPSALQPDLTTPEVVKQAKKRGRKPKDAPPPVAPIQALDPQDVLIDAERTIDSTLTPKQAEQSAAEMFSSLPPEAQAAFSSAEEFAQQVGAARRTMLRRSQPIPGSRKPIIQDTPEVAAAKALAQEQQRGVTIQRIIGAVEEKYGSASAEVAKELINAAAMKIPNAARANSALQLFGQLPPSQLKLDKLVDFVRKQDVLTPDQLRFLDDLIPDQYRAKPRKLESQVAEKGGQGVDGFYPGLVDLKTLEGLPEEVKPIVSTMINKIGQRLFDSVQVSFGGEARSGKTIGDIDMGMDFISIYNHAVREKRVTETLVHEFWHYLSKYISPDEVRSVQKEYENAVAAYKKQGSDDLPYYLSNVDEYFAATLTDLTMKYLGRPKPEGAIGKFWAKTLDVFEQIWDAIRQTLGYEDTKRIMHDFLDGNRQGKTRVSDELLRVREASIRSADEIGVDVRKIEPLDKVMNEMMISFTRKEMSFDDAIASLDSVLAKEFKEYGLAPPTPADIRYVRQGLDLAGPDAAKILESQADPILTTKEMAEQLNEARSSKIAHGLDKVGERILDSAVGRQLTAMFDQSVLGQLSKEGQEAARAAYNGYREAITRERSWMSRFLRTWNDTEGIREDIIADMELRPLADYEVQYKGDKKAASEARLKDARVIQNQRVNDLRRILERPLWDETGEIDPNALVVTPESLPEWVGKKVVNGQVQVDQAARASMAKMLAEFRTKTLKMITREWIFGINTARIDGYFPRIKSDLPGAASSPWNPNYGKLLDPTHPHQKRRKDYLIGYTDGSSVINDISIDPEFSGVHAAKKVRQELTNAEVDKYAAKVWEKYKDRLDESSSDLEWTELDRASDGSRMMKKKVSDLTREMMNLDPAHAKHQIPLFSNDLFSAMELRLEHHHRSIMHASAIRNILQNKAVAKNLVDDKGVVLQDVLDNSKYNSKKAGELVRYSIPKDQLLEADKNFWNNEIAQRVQSFEEVVEANAGQAGQRLTYKDPGGRPFSVEIDPRTARVTLTLPDYIEKASKKNVNRHDLIISWDSGDPASVIAKWEETIPQEQGFTSLEKGIPDPKNIQASRAYDSPHPNAVVFQQIAVPLEVGQAVTKFVNGPKVLDEVKPLVRGYDKFTNMWKMMQTGMMPFLGFHGRNFGSGQASNFYLGVQKDPRFASFNLADPSTYLNPVKSFTAPIGDAHKIATGQTVKGIADAPMFRGRGLTDEQATEELRKVIFTHGVVGEKQGIAAEQLMDTVGTAATQYPGIDAANAINPLAWKWSDPVPESTFAQRWLMPWMSKGVLADKDIFRPGQLGRDLGGYTESLNRLSPFIAMIRQGYDPKTAAEMVNRAQVDYTSMSNFNREYTRRLFPFASYTLGMAPTVARQLMERPGGGMARTVMATTQAGQTAEQGVTPDYIRETASIPLGMSEDGTRSYITGFGLPFEDPLQFAQLGKGNVSGLLRELGSRMNPIPKSLIEIMTGRSLYQAGPFGGREIEDLDPTIGRILANVNDLVTGEKTERAEPFLGNPWAEYLIANAGPGRTLNTIRTATDPRKWDIVPWKLALNLGTGVRVADVSPSAQDAILRERLAKVMKDFGGRMYSRPYFPDYAEAKWTPEEAADAAKIDALLKLLGQRAKERRVE